MVTLKSRAIVVSEWLLQERHEVPLFMQITGSRADMQVSPGGFEDSLTKL